MSQCKIALLGNMNNSFFTLSRYLKDLGYDAQLYVFPYEPAHFQPATDTFSNDLKSFVHFLKWGNPFDLLTTDVATIKKDLAGFDYYIASGTGPAYLSKAGITVDICIPYGSDLYDLPFFKLVRPRKLWHYFIFTRYQQRGIRNARFLNILDNSSLFKEKLSSIGFKGKRLYSGIPVVYAPQYKKEEIKKLYNLSMYYRAFERIRLQYDLVIFHHSRHCWKNEPDPVSIKDNDKLFKGLASFLETSNKKAAIITFEYGHDVDASKELCTVLKIEAHVYWFPLMPRREIMIGISLSDVVAGEFKNSWFTYGVVFEAMVSGKPVMHYREDSLYEGLELYPMIYAKEVEDITNALLHYSDRKTELSELGLASWKWFERNILEKSLTEICNILIKRNKA